MTKQLPERHQMTKTPESMRTQFSIFQQRNKAIGEEAIQLHGSQTGIKNRDRVLKAYLIKLS